MAEPCASEPPRHLNNGLRNPGGFAADRLDAVHGAGPPNFDRILYIAAIGLLCWCALNLCLPLPVGLPTYFFKSDLLWLLSMIAVLCLLGRVTKILDIRADWIAALCRPLWLPAILAVATGVVALLGGHFVYHDFALSRDEVMARFDASILREGRVLADVPTQWNSFADSLQPRFTLPVPGHAAWVSTYLPGNAALRALFDNIAGVNLASPILAAVSVAATFGVARQIWPERRDAAVVSGLLLATSAQAIVTAFTPYAMTAHLALNMAWLWFFLRGRPSGHVVAILIGGLACGLHQMVFHPLFAAPFIIQLWLNRRWAAAGSYTLAYAMIGLFWISYRHLVLQSHGLQGAEGLNHGVAALGAQVADLLRDFDWSGFALMAKNLTRFIAWQNPLVVPLGAVGLAALRNNKGPLPALAIGVLLAILAMFVLLPYQGHGWGYRYLHGFLGSVCLLAALGWTVLVPPGGAPSAKLRSQLLAACLFAIVVQLPGRAFEVERFIKPFVLAERAITAVPTGAVVVDTRGMPFSEDLVRNDPFLRGRPLVFDLKSMTLENVRSLCARAPVTVFDIRDGQRLALPLSPMSDSPQRDLMDALGCGASMPRQQP